MFAFLISIFWFDVLKQVWMIAHLTQLNQDVLVVSDRVSFFNHALFQQVSVDLLLLLSDSHLNMDFDFGWQRLLNFFFDSSQKEGFQNTMQLLDNLLVSLLLVSLSHFFACISEVEPLVKVV